MIGGMDKDMMQAMLTLLVNKAKSDGKIKKEREHRENTMDSMDRKGMMAGALGQVAGLGAQAAGMMGGGGGWAGQDPNAIGGQRYNAEEDAMMNFAYPKR